MKTELELSNRMLAFCSTNNQKTATERGACPAPFPFGYDAQPDAHAKKAHKSVRLSCIRLIFAVCCDIIFLLENNGYLAKSRLYSLVVVQDCGYAAIQSNTPRDGLGAYQHPSDLPEPKRQNPLTHGHLRVFRNFRNCPKIRL